MKNVDFGVVNVNLIAGPFGGMGPNYSMNVGSILFAFSETACVVFCDFTPYNLPYQLIYVVDESGDFTKYLTPVKTGGHITSITPIGIGSFFMSTNDGQFFQLGLGNHRLNNSTPIIVTAVSKMSNSCVPPGNAVSATFVDIQNKLIAAAWYVGAGQLGTEIYASVYKIGIGGILKLVTDGYNSYACPDCAPPVNNVFDQTATSSPPWYYPVHSAQLSNGYLTTTLLGDRPNYPNYYGTSHTNVLVNPGNTQYFDPASNCTTGCSPIPGRGCPMNCTCGNGVYVKTKQNGFFVTNFKGGNNAYSVDFTLPNFSGLTFGPGYLGGSALYDGYDTLYNVNFNDSVDSTNLLVTTKKLFVLGGNNNIYVTDNPGIVTSGKLTRNSYTTINSTRPISITGSYKT